MGRTRRRSYYGGAGVQATASPSSYSSAATWMNAINGTQDAQYGRVFNQSSPFPPNGNAIIGAQGQRAGGRRRRHRSRRHKRRTHHRRHRRTHRYSRRGGTLGGLEAAVVPAALIGMHHYYGRRHSRRHGH